MLPSCSPLAIDLFELVALVAVAVALGIAIVIAGRGSAALLGRLLCSRLPGTPRRRQLAQAPALRAQVIAPAGQAVPTRSHSTLSLLGTQCSSLHISSVLPCSFWLPHQLLFCPSGFLESLVLGYNEAVLAVALEHCAAQGAAVAPLAGHGVTEAGGGAPCLIRC